MFFLKKSFFRIRKWQVSTPFMEKIHLKFPFWLLEPLPKMQCMINLTFQSQNPPNSKWPYSGNNGSKHPMLSISMACNVISCKKKSEETLKKSKSPILQCKFGSWAQKWPKIAKKTEHLIAIYSIFFYRYGIFWMPPSEFSHPGGSEYV